MCGLTNSHYRGNGHWVSSYPIGSSKNKYVQNMVVIPKKNVHQRYMYTSHIYNEVAITFVTNWT